MKKIKYEKNRICALLLFAIAIFLSSAESAQARSVHLIIDGFEFTFFEEEGYGVPFIDSANRTQVPVRRPLEWLGATVHFDEASRTVQIQKENTAIVLEIGGSMYVNGSEYPIDSPAIIVNSRTYMPIRAVFTALGYDVDWEQKLYTINVSSKDNPNKGWSLPIPTAYTAPFLYEEVAMQFSYFGGTVSLSNPAEYDGGVMVLGAELRIGATMTLYNQSDETIIISPLDFRLELTKDGAIVFNKACPSFDVEIPARSSIYRYIPVDYWERGFVVGNYEMKLIFPERFVYRFKGGPELRYLDVKENMYHEIHEFSVIN